MEEDIKFIIDFAKEKYPQVPCSYTQQDAWEFLVELPPENIMEVSLYPQEWWTERKSVCRIRDRFYMFYMATGYGDRSADECGYESGYSIDRVVPMEVVSVMYVPYTEEKGKNYYG